MYLFTETVPARVRENIRGFIAEVMARDEIDRIEAEDDRTYLINTIKYGVEGFDNWSDSALLEPFVSDMVEYGYYSGDFYYWLKQGWVKDTKRPTENIKMSDFEGAETRADFDWDAVKPACFLGVMTADQIPQGGEFPVTLIFGHNACDLFDEGVRDVEELRAVEGCKEAVVIRTFETQEARDAFIAGADAGIDWSCVSWKKLDLGKE